MKAAVLREKGNIENVRIEEVDIPAPKAGEVLIKVQYAAFNRRDVFITKGAYPGIVLPSVLGADGAGEVAEVGEGVQGFEKGSQVIVNPSLNWGDDPRFNGPDFKILGMPVDGTFAQYVCVPAENVYPKPQYLSMEEAAAIPLAALTAYRAVMTRGQLKQGETVLIPGIGSGVAIFALQIAVAVGARVFVTSSSDEKIERAKKLGAAGGVNYRSEGWTKQLQEMMGGADLVIDSVGGANLNHMIQLCNMAARIVNFGATTGPVPELLMPRIFFKHMDIKGTTMGSPQDFEGMLQLFNEHRIHPVIDRSYPLEQIKDAMNFLLEGKNFGKVTLAIPS